MRPFTFAIPKPLLPIKEKPIIEIIISQLKKYGFRRFILAVGYKSGMVEAYLGSGSRLGVRIDYLREKRFSGTAGPLAMLRGRLGAVRSTLLLMNGDILTNLNFGRMYAYHKRHKFEVTVGMKLIKERRSYGFIESKSGLVGGIAEKPLLSNYVNAGIYLIEPSAAREVPAKKFFTMPDLINKLAASGRRVGAYPIREFWLGVEELKNFEEVYNNKRILGSLRHL
jgi:NDP-sugar pyrophosphorylase family protein